MKALIYFILIATILIFTISCSNYAIKTEHSPQPTKISTISPEPTDKTFPTITPVSTPSILEVTVFHDLNGNEIQNPGEPPVAGVGVAEEDLNRFCITNREGKCNLGSFFSGDHHFIIDISNASIEDLEYIYKDKQVFQISQGRNARIYPFETRGVSIALGQGPLPLPMIADQGFGGIYSGSINQVNPSNEGLDILVEGDGKQIILANMGGEIKSIEDNCNRVTIAVNQNDLEFDIGLEYLTSLIVETGQKVEKGDGIGFIDPTLYNETRENSDIVEIACTTQPQLHYDVYGPTGDDFNGEWGWIDPSSLAPERGNPKPLFETKEQSVWYYSMFYMNWLP